MNIRHFFLQFLPRCAVGRMVMCAKPMHIDKPIGTLLLLWPTHQVLQIAPKDVPDADIFVAFTADAFLMRSTGRVVNDFADRNFDGAVERTRSRPFVKGLVSKARTLLLTVILCPMAALCLVPLNRFTQLMNLPALFPAVTYPFAKRFLPLPQLYLGLAFSFGTPMAFATVQDRVPPEAQLVFTANVLWTLAYGTICTMADKEGDLKVDIKTSAVTSGHHDISATMLCRFWFMVLMAILGIEISATWPYWLVLPITAYWQCQQYAAIRTRDRQLCLQTFLVNNRIGSAWFCGLVRHYFWLLLVSKLF